ncbi:hypothetical protein AAZV13_09G229100 [Glycine max]|nr:hypothetical protein JHK86_026479 [Glycine max]
MMFEEQYQPKLVMVFAIPMSQQLTGINIVAFYAPDLFQSMGVDNDLALLLAVILGLVNLGSILVSTAIVDHFGRRFLYIIGSIQMLICMIVVVVVLAVVNGVHGTEHISKLNARMKKKGSRAVTEVLIQWQHTNPEDAIWKELHSMQHQFPDFDWRANRP